MEPYPPGPVLKWWMGLSAKVDFRRLPGLIAAKHSQSYGTTMSLVRCKIAFSLVQSEVVCLCGAETLFSCPCQVHRSGGATPVPHPPKDPPFEELDYINQL